MPSAPGEGADRSGRAGRKAHWDAVYCKKAETEVSWFEDTPTVSLELLDEIGATPASRIIDVGAGASRLVDALLALGFKHVTVLDLSEAALTKAKQRLGNNAARARWCVADVTSWIPAETCDIWHDRAAFHFLTYMEDRAGYLDTLEAAVIPGGQALIATFAPDGPEKCGGLPVVRYSPQSLSDALGPNFTLVRSRDHRHVTPRGTVQSFQFSVFQRS